VREILQQQKKTCQILYEAKTTGKPKQKKEECKLRKGYLARSVTGTNTCARERESIEKPLHRIYDSNIQ
jgi:hypothetical protein